MGERKNAKLNMRIPTSLATRLEAAAQRRSTPEAPVTVSDVVREILERHAPRAAKAPETGAPDAPFDLDEIAGRR